MSEPRAPLESEIKNVVGFLNKHLRPGVDWSISAEYPQVFHPANRNNLRIITDQDQVLAHAAIKYLLIKNQFGIFKVAAIGSVVTDPNYRNQGLSQKILESCLLAAERETVDFAILWTDLFDYYRKFGFENVAGLGLEGVPQEVFFALSFDDRLPHGNVTFHEGFKANGPQAHAGDAAAPRP